MIGRRALAVVPAVVLAACLGLAPALAQEIARCPDNLPPLVAQKRDAILAGARARDYNALQKLIPGEAFIYSFGEGALRPRKGSIFSSSSARFSP